MNHKSFIKRLIIAASAAALLCGCEDDISPIGGSLVNGDVTINVDSLELKLDASAVRVENVVTRDTTTLLGDINVPEYGRLSASYVTQLMSAPSMSIPDSIGVERVDSMKLVLQIPRNMTIGDTLAPQQLKVYRLSGDKQIPSGITSDYPIAGSYDPSDVVLSKNYTLSGIALSDSAFTNLRVLRISHSVPLKWAVDAFNAYRAGDKVFEWPSSFCKAFPGLYIEPSFGRGAMANINSTSLVMYYHHFVTRTETVDEEVVTKRVTIKDSITLFSSSPEVISGSLLNFTPSQKLEGLVAKGQKILTGPLGYRVRLKFPAETILKQYWASDRNLAMINNLTMAIPASPVYNDYGIDPPADIVMVRTDKLDDFFENGRVPDNMTSFAATYSSSSGRYQFGSMRNYIVDLKNRRNEIKPEELDFTIIPVKLVREYSTSSSGTIATYVTGCSPYIERPCMVDLDTDNASIVFTFTNQLLE